MGVSLRLALSESFLTMEINALKSQIAVNERYARACMEIFEETGRESAANQAAAHKAAADRKRAMMIPSPWRFPSQGEFNSG